MKYLFLFLLVWHSEIFYDTNLNSNGVPFHVPNYGYYSDSTEGLEPAYKQAMYYLSKLKYKPINVLMFPSGFNVSEGTLLIWAEEKK